MNRRGFLSLLAATAAAEALEPMTGKVFSFPSKIMIVPKIPDEIFQYQVALDAYYQDLTAAQFFITLSRQHPDTAKIASGLKAAKRRNEQLMIEGVLNNGYSYRTPNRSQTS